MIKNDTFKALERRTHSPDFPREEEKLSISFFSKIKNRSAFFYKWNDFWFYEMNLLIN